MFSSAKKLATRDKKNSSLLNSDPIRKKTARRDLPAVLGGPTLTLGNQLLPTPGNAGPFGPPEPLGVWPVP